MYTTREKYSTELEDKACCIVGAECGKHCGCENGNDDNSDTRGSERKMWTPFLQCNHIQYAYLLKKYIKCNALDVNVAVRPL
jgi:hypothetical protein